MVTPAPTAKPDSVTLLPAMLSTEALAASIESVAAHVAETVPATGAASSATVWVPLAARKMWLRLTSLVVRNGAVVTQPLPSIDTSASLKYHLSKPSIRWPAKLTMRVSFSLLVPLTQRRRTPSTARTRPSARVRGASGVRSTISMRSCRLSL